MTSRPPDLLATLRGGRLIVAVIVAVGLLAALGRAFAGAYVEILWQAQAGYLPAFWRRVGWEWGVRILAGVGVGLLVYLNLKVASATLGGIQIRRRFGNLEISEQIPKHYVAWAMFGAAALLGLWFGAAVPPSLGRLILLLANAEPWGLTDPIHGRDVAFYVFWVPALMSGVVYALIVTFLLFTLATAGYAATGALTWTRGRVVAQGLTRLHLGGILAAFFLLLALRLYLGGFYLLMDGSSAVQGIFGYTDAQARLPAYQTLAVICLGASAGTVWGAWKNRPAPVIASLTSVVLGTVLIGNVYPSLIQSFRVEPNELERESRFIDYNLEFTRLGFGLEGLERRPYDYDADEVVDWNAGVAQFAGLPVWNRGALLTAYSEREALFPYYDFSDVTIDRYPTAEGPVPVAVSVREIEPGGIQDPNWQNRHLRELYVAGMGAVASLAAVRSTEGRPEMLVRGIPPEVAVAARGIAGLDLVRPEVFFGTRLQQEYAVVSPGPEQYLAPDGAAGVPGVDYPEGIRLTSGIRTALLAWRFREANLLFSSELTEESRFIYRRLVTERARAVAPFLRFPEAPYPVLADGKITWILEGFTASLAFPLATVYDFGALRRTARYVRNSVKVTVDAVTGQVDLYRVAIDDPLLDTYAAAYPELFKPIDQMPAVLREHLRYARAMLRVQGQVLLQYHQETAPVFHGQRDVWDVPQELSDNPGPVPYEAEYGIYRLSGEDEERFQLTSVFVPAGRQNLTAILVARTDGVGVPELILYDVPVDDQVQGPRQIEALVEQDPTISQQLSLWRGGGSVVWTGHLHLVPVGKRLLYMEPIFLAAEEDAIPELRRFVVSDGRRVAMTESLVDAVGQLAGFAVASASLDQGDSGVAPVVSTEAWPAAALELLERAEARAREGDWQGFGEALDELRALLQRLEGGGR